MTFSINPQLASFTRMMILRKVSYKSNEGYDDAHVPGPVLSSYLSVRHHHGYRPELNLEILRQLLPAGITWVLQGNIARATNA